VLLRGSLDPGDNGKVIRLSGFLGCVIGLVACGSDDGYNLPPGSDSGPRPDGSGSGSDAGRDGPDDGGIDGPIDGTKPMITIVSPPPGALLAGDLRLVVDVDDDTGISNVTATIGGVHEIPMALDSGKRYVGTFDTLPLAGLVAPTIVVRAVDLGGDMTELGYSIVLDNTPPLGAFDPPNVRLTRIAQGELECSAGFDPMGSDTPNDGESVPQLVELRARVLDLSNTGTVSTPLAIPHAGVSKVEMFVFDDSTKPLVVTSDGDGTCDAINPQIVPATVPMLPSEAAVIELTEITPGGGAFFPAGLIYGGSNVGCSAGTDVDPPAPLCFAESVTTAIQEPFTTRGQIYGIPPASTSNCLGFAFDNLASNISDGWACVAVVVEDALGNRSVSAPLRVCIDSDNDGAEGCGPYGSTNPPAERPNCTGTYNPSTGQVTSTPCTPREFPRSNVANDFELVPL
jgi:hypothetical protein